MLSLVAVVGSAGCGESRCQVALEGGDCQSSADCIEAGFTELACVNGRCRAICFQDQDCRQVPDAVCSVDPAVSSAICVQRTCEAGCPAAPCPAGERCFDGRCALYRESFEGDDGGTPNLASLGWGGLGELRNPNLGLALDCTDDCGAADPGGPAADGRRFAVIGTEPAPEKGTARTAPTCRACACCLGCILDPPLVAPSILDCPTDPIPARLFCGPERESCDEPAPGDAVPTECEDVCAACDGCADRDEAIPGGLLTSCERRAAEKVCRPCAQCDDLVCRACRDENCAEACDDILSEACEQCEEAAGCADCVSCRDCTACEDAEQPGPRQPDLRGRCDALGADGCFPTPVDYPRAELTDAEQALTSPPIDLSAASGPVLLEFRYVPFNIGSVHTVTEQGTSACEWAEALQEVRVQVCGGGCDRPEAWVDLALSAEGERLPPDAQRGNGLRLAGQSGIDWSIGRAQATLPAELVGPQTRIRFLPRLSEFARLGVDAIVIRSAQ